MIRKRGDRVAPSASRIFATAAGYLSSMILIRALQAGVFRLLAQSPKSAERLAAETGMSARDAMDLLDTLVALGLLTRDGGMYANTPESAYYLDPASEAYAGSMIRAMPVAA